MRRLGGGLSFLVALVVAACGSSAGTAAPTAAQPTVPATAAVTAAATLAEGGVAGNLPDACSLLTKEEIAQAVGNAVADGSPDVLNSCKWEGAGLADVSVGLHLLALGNAKCAVGEAGSTAITGLSAPASWTWIATADSGSIVACQSGVQLQVTMVGDVVGGTKTEESLKAAATKLMGLVLGRI